MNLIDLSELKKRKQTEKKISFQAFINLNILNTPETRDRYSKCTNEELLDWLSEIIDTETKEKGKI